MSNPSIPCIGIRLLPKDFSPSIDEVIVGRGKKVTSHCGNKRFRDKISSEIEDYMLAENKIVKSQVISRVLQEVKDWSPATGAFVKQDAKTQRWYAVEEATARNTTAQAFRDANSSGYKSSKKSKQQRRLHRKISTDSSLDYNCPTPTINPMEASLPMMPAKSSGFPSLPRQVSIDDTFEDISGFAWEQGTPVSPIPLAQEVTRQALLDLDALWEDLDVPTMATENPFEPTPIVPSTPAMIAPCGPMEPLPVGSNPYGSISWETQTATRPGQLLKSQEDGSGFSLQWALSRRREMQRTMGY